MDTKTLKRSGAKYNPRRISKGALDRLKKALKEFGDLSGIIYNRRTQTLIGGHQRLKVIPDNAIIQKNELPEPSPTGTVAEGFIIIDGERYVYREVDWDIQKEKMANIAANAHGGEWDEALLHDLLKDLTSTEGFDLDLTGFDLAGIHQVLGTDINDVSAEALQVMSEQMRNSREIFEKVKRGLEKQDEALDCYLVVIFQNQKKAEEFLNSIGLTYNRYIDGRELQRALSVV